MSAALPSPYLTFAPATRGRINAAIGAMGVGVFRLPSDPLKYVTLTFDGVNANSEIRIYRDSDNSETAGVELCDTDHVFSSIPYYGTGQVSTIRIVHHDYKIKEFSYTIPGTDQTIPIQQERDKWYSNP
jgi:hypothetical protein